MAEPSSNDAAPGSVLLRVFGECRLSPLCWVIVSCVLLAGVAWVCMNQLVVFGNSIHDRITAEPDPELPEGLTREEQLMYTISDLGGPPARDAVDEIVASGDTRYIAVMVEMLRANEATYFMFGAGARQHLEAAEALAGQRIRAEFGELSNTWIKWYATTDYEPPTGFTTWKGHVFSRHDPMFAELLHDDQPSRIRTEEIRYGGVPFDGIRAIDQPKMIAHAVAGYLYPDEPVFGLVVNGDARAYPQRIVDWHEMVNDIVGGVPVSLSYCSLCGAAIAYDGRASDGATYTFGTSGLLYRSNKLMYDRQTRTLWNQFTGRPVLGRLVTDDPQLKTFPVVVTEWQDWKEDHPETVVMDLNTGYRNRYRPGSAYGRYYASDETMFPVGQVDDRLPAKSRVFGIRFGNVAKAYPLHTLTVGQVVNDRIAETGVVLVALRDTVDVFRRLRRRNPDRRRFFYEAGGEVRAFDRGRRLFRPGPDGQSVIDEEGLQWRVTELELVGPDGQTVPRIFGTEAYWFGWYAFNEDTLVYESPGKDAEAVLFTE